MPDKPAPERTAAGALPRSTETVQPPPAGEFVDTLMEAGWRHLRASRGRLKRATDDPTELAIRVGCSVAGRLQHQVDDLATIDDEYEHWFEDRYLALLAPGFDLMRLMVTVGQEMSAHCMRVLPGPSRSERVEAIIELQAHAILVGGETLDLLRGGWPAGAEARWRTLHEIEVIALFLERSPLTVSRRYLASRDTALARHLSRDEIPIGRLEGGKALIHEMESRAATVLRTHGPEMAHTYGWAARWLRKKQVTFKDLESRVAPRRPAYVSASNRIHAGRVGALASLLDGPGRFVTGRRVEGVVDVALQALWSLNTVTGALLRTCGPAVGTGDLQIWDEVQTEIAGEADTELRRAEMTRLSSAGRHQESLSYMPSVGAGRVRMERAAITPQHR